LAKAIFWGAGTSDKDRRTMAWEIRSRKDTLELGPTYKDVVRVPGEYSPKVTDDDLLKETIRDDAQWESWDRTVWIATDVAGAPDFDNPLQKDATPIWPVKSRQVTSGFGNRPDPFDAKKTKFHYGIDIRASLGEAVYATESGVVVKMGTDNTGANRVIIEGISGYYTGYYHMKPSVREGQKVKKGQIIGNIDLSGRSTAPHLHFTVSPDGTIDNRVNPEEYLP
jgi:murein DD-endopeptidase MepM/ murein hydrolase activator NlpD